MPGLLDRSLEVLLIDDSLGDTALIREAFRECDGCSAHCSPGSSIKPGTKWALLSPLHPDLYGTPGTTGDGSSTYTPTNGMTTRPKHAGEPPQKGSGRARTETASHSEECEG